MSCKKLGFYKVSWQLKDLTSTPSGNAPNYFESLRKLGGVKVNGGGYDKIDVGMIRTEGGGNTKLELLGDSNNSKFVVAKGQRFGVQRISTNTHVYDIEPTQECPVYGVRYLSPACETDRDKLFGYYMITFSGCR